MFNIVSSVLRRSLKSKNRESTNLRRSVVGNLANSFFTAGDFDQAAQLYSECLQSELQILGENDPYVLYLLNGKCKNVL